MTRTERNTAGNSTYKKLAVQWLNDPESYRDCASYQMQCWQTVFIIEIANFLKPPNVTCKHNTTQPNNRN
jgi:hypothetical protein